MSVQATRPAFDQNDKKYFVFCGNLHIRVAAKATAILLNVFTAVNLVFSLSRNSTIALYTLMTVAFSVVVFGGLLYGVVKEKRLYLVPYLMFQTISVVITMIVLLVFIISIAAQSNMVIELAEDWWNVDSNKLTQSEFDGAVASFTIIFIVFVCFSALLEALFLDIIYSYYKFLRDRESSFNFTFDNSNGFSPQGLFGTQPAPPQQEPPAYQ